MVVWIVFIFLSVVRHDYAAVSFWLNSSWLQSGYIWWCSMKFVFSWRTPRPSYECQVSFWLSGVAFLFLSIKHCICQIWSHDQHQLKLFLSLKFFFPGNAGKNPIRVADDIINAIVDFTRKHSIPSLKKVKVVIFVTELLNVFYDSMKKREKIATSPTFQSTFSKAACKMFF